MKTRSIRSWLAAAAIAVTVPGPPALAELVAYWAFDEGGGTNIADTSGWGNGGMLVNPKASTWTNGVTGSALYFDGVTGSGSTYISIPDAPSLRITDAISFAAWVRCDDTSRDAPILAKEGDGGLSYWFGTVGTGGSVPGNFGALLDADGNQPWSVFDRDQGSVPRGLWGHIVSTWDGTTIRHYLNGVALPETGAFAGPIFASDAFLAIGVNSTYNTTAFKGAMDEVRIYNHALTGDEVTALVGTVAGMVGHWAFDEGGGTNVTDHSGFSNHGTLVNAKSNTWTAGIRGSALYFDGTTGSGSTYVRIPDAPSLHIAAGISCAAWVRSEDIGRDAPILAKEGDGKLSYWFGTYGVTDQGSQPGNFGLLLDREGSYPWTLEDRNQGTVSTEDWMHVASTWDGTTVRHYLNGYALPETASFSDPIYVSDAFLAIGANSTWNYTAFKGSIDDVRLYNYALGQEEVRALYVTTRFAITSIVREGDGIRLQWECAAGNRYRVQTSADVTGVFGDVGPIIEIPSGSPIRSTNFLHTGVLTNPNRLFYRVKILLD